MKDTMHYRQRKASVYIFFTLNIGASWPTTDIPPTPRYCPTDTSRKNMGMPQIAIEKK